MPQPTADSARELVVLVHGMGRTPLAMLPLAQRLRRSGYATLNFGYSSFGPSIAQIGERLARRLQAALAARPAPRVHFVGHSLGNIVIRWLLVNARPQQLGQVVMLAPPNRGARLAARCTPYLRWLLAPLPELTREGGLCERLIAPQDVAIGIIAGRFDRKVRLEETHLRGAREHVVVAAGHTFIMCRPAVQALVLRFLRTARFAP